VIKQLMVFMTVLAWTAAAGANSFTAEGTVFEPTHGYTFVTGRNLLPDGDFEQGTCLAGSTWICTTTNTCDWIADLVPLGLWNYSGSHIAWLGGFCGGLATCTTTICKDFDLGICFLCWYWMAYVNDAIMHVYITVDGTPIYHFYPQLSDHLLDYQQDCTNIYADPVVHELCLAMEDPGCASNLGDNYFADYLEMIDLSSAIAPVDFSTVKALY